MKTPTLSQPAKAVEVQQHIAKLEAQVVAREAEIARLNIGIARLHAETAALRAGMELMRASVSWRLSIPVRILGRLGRSLLARQPALRWTIRKARERLRPVSLSRAAQMPALADPNAPYIFHPVPFLDGGAAVVRLNTLYYLSRSL